MSNKKREMFNLRDNEKCSFKNEILKSWCYKNDFPIDEIFKFIHRQ